MQISPAIPVLPNPFAIAADGFTLYCPPEEVSIPGMSPDWKLYKLGDGGANPTLRMYDYFGEYARGVIKHLHFSDMAAYHGCTVYVRNSLSSAQADTRMVNSSYSDRDSEVHILDYETRAVSDFARPPLIVPGHSVECAQPVGIWLIPTFPTTYDIKFNDMISSGAVDVRIRVRRVSSILFNQKLKEAHLTALREGVGRKEGLLRRAEVAESLAQTLVTKLLRWPSAPDKAGPVANAVVWRKDLGTQDYLVLDLIIAQPANGDNPSLYPTPGVGLFDQRAGSGIRINSASQIRSGGTSLHTLRLRVTLADSSFDTLDIWKSGYRGVVFDLIKPSLDTLGIDVRTEGVYLNLKEGLSHYLGQDLYAVMDSMGCNFLNLSSSASGSVSTILAKSTIQKPANDVSYSLVSNSVFSREELFLETATPNAVLRSENPFSQETRHFLQETQLLTQVNSSTTPAHRKAAFIKIVNGYLPLKDIMQEMALTAERGAEEDLLIRKLTAPVWDTFKERVRRDPALKRRILSASQESVKALVAKLVESSS